MSHAFPNLSAANLLHLVEPHAAKLEAIAGAMEKDGIGGDANNGHAVTLRRMAACMRADAAVGRMPNVYYDRDRLHATGDDLHAAAESPAKIAALNTCADAGIDPPSGGKFTLEQLNASLDAAFDRSAAGY